MMSGGSKGNTHVWLCPYPGAAVRCTKCGDTWGPDTGPICSGGASDRQYAPQVWRCVACGYEGIVEEFTLVAASVDFHMCPACASEDVFAAFEPFVADDGQITTLARRAPESPR